MCGDGVQSLFLPCWVIVPYSSWFAWSFNVQVILSSLLNEVSHHLRRLVFLMSHHESWSHGLQPLISPLKLLNNVSPNDSLRQLGIGSLLLS